MPVGDKLGVPDCEAVQLQVAVPLELGVPVSEELPLELGVPVTVEAAVTEEDGDGSCTDPLICIPPVREKGVKNPYPSRFQHGLGVPE